MANSIWGTPGGFSSNGATITFPLGTQITESALGVLAMVSSAAANQLQIPNGSNLEIVKIGWSSNVAVVGGVVNGGTARNCSIAAGAAINLSPNNGSDCWQVASTGAFGDLGTHTMTVGGVLTTNTATNLVATGVALTDSAGAQVATMTNGPTAGNPTKWFAINDNGTQRKIPAW